MSDTQWLVIAVLVLMLAFLAGFNVGLYVMRRIMERK